MNLLISEGHWLSEKGDHEHIPPLGGRGHSEKTPSDVRLTLEKVAPILIIYNKEGVSAMKCQRCQGLMVRDQILDPDGPYLHIQTLRCVNCGDTVYIDKKVLLSEDQSRPTDRKKPKAA